jgi:hypothetical protein
MSKTNVIRFPSGVPASEVASRTGATSEASPIVDVWISKMDRCHKRAALLKRIMSDEITDIELDQMLKIRPGPDRDPNRHRAG